MPRYKDHEARIQRILALHAAGGKSQRQIAQEVGCSAKFVNKTLNAPAPAAPASQEGGDFALKEAQPPRSAASKEPQPPAPAPPPVSAPPAAKEARAKEWIL